MFDGFVRFVGMGFLANCNVNDVNDFLGTPIRTDVGNSANRSSTDNETEKLQKS